MNRPKDKRMTDTERIDWLERAIIIAADWGESSAVVVLSAWYSSTAGPDGFSVRVGELALDPDEYPSLREAIDAARSGAAADTASEP